MVELPTRSPLKFKQLADGSIRIPGRPDVTVRTHEDQVCTDFPDWERQLGLPKYEEEWDALSIVQGVSERQVRFILCDESPTKFAGHGRMPPAHIRFVPARYRFTLGHNLEGAYVIGFCYVLTLLPVQSLERMLASTALDLPETVQGDCLVGQAVLYRQGLADKAWDGIQRDILTHVCAVVNQKPEDPAGAGDLVEIALVSEVEAGCLGARVLKTWEA